MGDVTLKNVSNIKAKLEGRGDDAIRTDIYIMALQEHRHDPVLCYKREPSQLQIVTWDNFGSSLWRLGYDKFWIY